MPPELVILKWITYGNVGSSANMMASTSEASRFFLYLKENFLKEDLAIESVRKKAVKGQTIIPLTKIHEGKIAVVVYHDEDSNNINASTPLC